MKKLLAILSLIFSFHYLYAQNKESWNQYLKDSVYKSDDGNFISYIKGKGPKLITQYFYSYKNKQYTLAINNADSVVEYRIIESPFFFQIAYENFDGLKILPEYIQKKGLFKNLVKDYYDTSKISTQLGIKYHTMHFNHFQKFSEEQINNTKKEKLKKAMIAVNQLYAIFEELEKNIK